MNVYNKYYSKKKKYKFQRQMLKRLFNLSTFQKVGQGIVWLMLLPFDIKSKYSNIQILSTSSWDAEKTDIIDRANWLCEKIIISPKSLIKSMPAVLGEEYAGQWAIYCCSMLAHALANISVIYPEYKAENIDRIRQLIEIANTPEIRHYDTIM